MSMRPDWQRPIRRGSKGEVLIYDVWMTVKTFRIAAWLVLAFIIFVTVSPTNLRPSDYLPGDIDRAGAFALMGGLFVMAYPRHWVFAALLIVLSAGVIELLQELSPTRHAHVHDALVKAAGAGIGVVVGRFVAAATQGFSCNGIHRQEEGPKDLAEDERSSQ
jgi:hypothetical protein